MPLIQATQVPPCPWLDWPVECRHWALASRGPRAGAHWPDPPSGPRAPGPAPPSGGPPSPPGGPAGGPAGGQGRRGGGAGRPEAERRGAEAVRS